MRTLLLAISLGATAMPIAAAEAQTPRQSEREYREDVRDAQRDYRDDVRDARQDRREERRDWRQYRRYDHNRLEPGQRQYYADRYYRDDPSYRPRRLGRNDRIYRGQDDRYYCRRSDGTTGLVIGAGVGGLLGNTIAGGGSRLLGTIIGGGAGALLGREVERGSVSCR